VSDAAPALPPDAVEVGRVLGAWGIKGAIRVKAFAADPQALFSSKRWYAQLPTSGLPAAVECRPPALLRVIEAREQGDAVVATAHELADRNAAEAFKGARIFVSRASFPTPDVDEFYWVDLIGLAVHDRTGLRLGAVIGLIETGPHCVLRVQPDAGAEPMPGERLIPFVNAYIDKVDLAGRRIDADWPFDEA
jgi:16S rRNA processing protein RimM